MSEGQSTRRPARDERRAQLLAAARKLFVSDGYAKTPVSAIVAEVGVAQGTFYLYFKTKQDVLTELRRMVFRDYATAFLTVARSSGPADERMAHTLFVMAAAVRRNQDLERVFRAAESAEATEQAGLEGRKRMAKEVETLLKQGIASGAMATHQDTAYTAWFAVTLFERTLYEALEYGVPADLDTVVVEGVRFALQALGVSRDRIDELVEFGIG